MNSLDKVGALTVQYALTITYSITVGFHLSKHKLHNNVYIYYLVCTHTIGVITRLRRELAHPGI